MKKLIFLLLILSLFVSNSCNFNKNDINTEIILSATSNSDSLRNLFDNDTSSFWSPEKYFHTGESFGVLFRKDSLFISKIFVKSQRKYKILLFNTKGFFYYAYTNDTVIINKKFKKIYFVLFYYDKSLIPNSLHKKAKLYIEKRKKQVPEIYEIYFIGKNNTPIKIETKIAKTNSSAESFINPYESTLLNIYGDTLQSLNLHENASFNYFRGVFGKKFTYLVGKYKYFDDDIIFFPYNLFVSEKQDTIKSDILNNYIKIKDKKIYTDFNDSDLVSVKPFIPDAIEDIKYATANNFTGVVLYDCGDCYLRYEAVKDLIKAAEEFRQQNCRIVLYDCYRPLAVQYKMWEVYPHKNYVADPRKGSMHNKGVAVDISLADSSGKYIDMGTKFDYFGPKASPEYKNLPEKVLMNRYLLRKTMKKYYFSGIKSEWWHFSHRTRNLYDTLNIKIRCNDRHKSHSW